MEVGNTKVVHITVGVAGDIHPDIVVSLTESADIEVLQLPSEIADLHRRCKRHSPSVLLVGEQFIHEAGPTLISELERAEEPTRILVLCNLEPGFVIDLLHMGCSGVLGLRTPLPDIHRAIKAVSSGELWFPRKVMSTAVRSLQSTVSEKRLTQREKEVLTLIGQGFSNREIADKMFITRETVRWHVRGLYSKIGTRDRKRVTAIAHSNASSEPFAS